MKTALVLVVESLLLATSPALASKLFGAKMLRVVPGSHDQLQQLHSMLDDSPYDLWKEPRDVGMPVDIMATVSDLPELERILMSHGLVVEELIKDVGQMIVQQSLAVYTRGPRTMDWEDYHDYTTIIKWMASLAKDYPDICTLEEVGKSFEDRPMKLIVVGTGGPDNPAIFIDGGIHGREWIAPATVTYMINKLVTNSSEYEDLLSRVNFYFMPVVNPDGYDFTFMDPNNRLWRKTRSDYRPKEVKEQEAEKNPLCIGVDANRNWDHHWMEGGASNKSCRHTYAGPKPFSEIENIVLRDQILKLGHKLKIYLSFHSYGQQFMYPWGYTHVYPDDWRDLDSLAQKAVRALASVYGTNYTIGTTNNIFHKALAGGSHDWVKSVGNVKFSYTVELDDGNFFFCPSNSAIIPAGEETFMALLVLADYVKETYGD